MLIGPPYGMEAPLARTLEEIVQSNHLTQDELDALVRRFDENGDGQLEGDEVRQFAQAVAPLVGSTMEDLMVILDFYQSDDDPALSPGEIRDFLEIQI